jgi:hypothetical protein
VSAILFQGPLTAQFQPTKCFMITATEPVFDFEIVVSGSTTVVQYYLEFSPTQDANGKWYREIAEEDVGGGVVNMPAVVRTLLDNAGSNLPVGMHRFDAEFKRRHQFIRLQLMSPGTATCIITAPFAEKAY